MIREYSIEDTAKYNRIFLPLALDSFTEIKNRIKGRRVAVFLDYDGTLTPIVDSPEKALLSKSMRDTVFALSKLCMVGVISGRDLFDVKRMVSLDGIFYAGSHGFDISGPENNKVSFQKGTEYLPLLDDAEKKIKKYFSNTKGILIERKKFSLTLHYRKAVNKDIEAADQIIEKIIKEHTGLKRSSGKMVFEIQPDIEWNKGSAVSWLLNKFDIQGSEIFPIYLGDDTTDEDAFRAIKGLGLGIVVMEKIRKTEADQMLHSSAEVEKYLKMLVRILEDK